MLLLLICDEVNSFSQEMEEFVQSSGENGIVVFTLGSMISKGEEPHFSDSMSRGLSNVTIAAKWNQKLCSLFTAF